ncbi:fungal-specific transcription factor domain-containing protein [Pyronema domesticum]|nr:fungal-specific transcription factor domain-containing protein [Pyronema domesticum]
MNNTTTASTTGSSTNNIIPPTTSASGPGAASSSGQKKSTANIDSPIKNMRSSIACVRCRRSKVKCVNTGPNTMCRACEASNRDCTYPQPVMSGTPRATANTVAVNSVGNSNQIAGGNADRTEPPKKAKPKKPSANASQQATSASLNTPGVWKDCLNNVMLTHEVWTSIFEAFQLHHSPMLPFLHPPTFLNRLRASSNKPGQPSTGNSPPPEKPHSPLLLLGMLALTARHVPQVLDHYRPAFTAPVQVSEFYASALKWRIKMDDEANMLTPALDKIQALLMLSIHEWGQTRKVESYMFLGVAIRMCGYLGLSWVDTDDSPAAAPYSPEPETEEPVPFKRRKLDNGTSAKLSHSITIEKEIGRRTFWAVFLLDRALSSGRHFPSMVASTDANRVQLPCDERGFMFGAEQGMHSYLNSELLLKPDTTNSHQDTASGERVLAHVVKAMELWGRIQIWTETNDNFQPMEPESSYNLLSKALEHFCDTLPHQLEYTPGTLQVHLSTRSSSPYALLHVTLFLARITLERKCLPELPFVSPRPQGPIDTYDAQLSPAAAQFYLESAERYMAASRDLVSLISALDEWNAKPESPFIIMALERAAKTGLYAYSFPWMDVRGSISGVSRLPDHEPMGSGEEARKAIEFINAIRDRWQIAQESRNKISEMQGFLSAKIEQTINNSSHDGKILQEKVAAINPNKDERHRIFEMLTPPTPKQPVAVVQVNRHSDEVDILLSAASGEQPIVQQQTERWMAVNTSPASLPLPPPTQPQQQVKEEGGSLDQLAVFASQQGKIGREVEMGDAQQLAKKEETKEEGWRGAAQAPTWQVGALEG